MKKLLISLIYVTLIITLSGCPKKADIIYRQEIVTLPKEYSCLVNELNNFEGVIISNIRDLKNNSPLNGYAISFDTKHSSTRLTVYELTTGEIIYNVSTWVEYNVTKKQRTKINNFISNITLAIKEKCLTTKLLTSASRPFALAHLDN